MVQHAPYDPQEAHDYYERHKHLKGRNTTSNRTAAGAQKSVAKPKSQPTQSSINADKARARIGRLRSKISKLQAALAACEAEMAKKRQTKEKTAKENSDGKTTAKQRQSSKSYRDKHKAELKSKRKEDSKASGGSSGDAGGGLSSMSFDELVNRSIKIKAALSDAKRQLSNANQQLGELAHSAILSEPNVNELFAHFQSAERIPSK